MPHHDTRTSPHRRTVLAAGVALLLAGVAVAVEPEPRPAGVTVIPEQGARLPEAPGLLPGAPIPADADPIDLASERVLAGNTRGAMTLLEDWLEGRHPELKARDWRKRWVGARFMLGLLYLREDHPNLASSQFTRVRLARGALESEAAYLEAWADHARGRHRVAARECAAYRKKWPKGRHVEDCLLLEGDALTDAGTFTPAYEAYQRFIDLDKDGPDVEIAKLGQARARINRSARQAVTGLQAAALDYRYPTSRDIALAELATLAEQGLDTTLPSDGNAKIRELVSTYSSREYERAHTLWAELQQDESPHIQAWLKKNIDGYGWNTRSYELLVELYIARLETNHNPETCWMGHRAAMRGGLWEVAAELGEQGLTKHSGHWRWRAARDDVALASLLAGRHERALALYDQLAANGGRRGREASWYAAFTAYRAGDWADAAKRLEQVRTGDRARAVRATYWLGRVAEAEGEPESAQARYLEVMRDDPHGWYGLLAHERVHPLDRGGQGWLVRDGDWPIPPPAAPLVLDPMPVVAPPAVEPPQAHGALALPEPRSPDWGALSWSEPAAPPGLVEPPAAAAATAAAHPAHLSGPRGEAPARTILEGRYYGAEHAREAFADFTRRYKGVWPELLEIQQLAEVGAYDLSGELMARVYDEIERAQKGHGPKAGRVPGIGRKLSLWRELFLYTHAWHLVSRFSGRLDEYTDDPEEKRQALALEFPAAFPEHVWAAAHEHDIDPLLVLAVMRTESHYKSWAVSRSNAQGLMQILPVTGARVAHDMGRERYSPRELMDPGTNIQFGAWYLRQLIDRFGGCVPMAAAAYNAGPHAVSDWRAPMPDDTPIDEFVELIPIEQPRTYVRRVMGFYRLHAMVHGPDGARVAVPMSVGTDDASVIDY